MRSFIPVNVFAGVLDNSLFVGILLTTAVLQVLIVEYGSIAFGVIKGGLNGYYWGLSLGLGALSLVVQQIINILYRAGQQYIIMKNKKRKSKYGHLSTQRLNGDHPPHTHSHTE
jgi:P-type Ca2+ transporter type 2B